MEQKEIKITIPEGYEIDKEQSTFEEIVFKKKDNKYLKTWEECIDKLNSSKTRFCYIAGNSELHETYDCYKKTTEYNILPSKEIAEKFLILQKLYTCRQAYIGDWKPDFLDFSVIKYCIKNDTNVISIRNYTHTSSLFSFPTEEMAKEFLINFNDDLEKIKEFL